MTGALEHPCMLIAHKDYKNTIQGYFLTVMTHENLVRGYLSLLHQSSAVTIIACLHVQNHIMTMFITWLNIQNHIIMTIFLVWSFIIIEKRMKIYLCLYHMIIFMFIERFCYLTLTCYNAWYWFFGIHCFTTMSPSGVFRW